MKGLFYLLNDDHTYTECNVDEWRNSFLNDDRHIADDSINDYRVSTVWVGIDHNVVENELPLVFETMVFNKDRNEIYCDRYSTWEQAEKGHQEAIQWVKDGCKGLDL